jgi:hypothetical protein
MKQLKLSIFVLLCTLTLSVPVYGRTCYRCHGSGRQQTFYSVSTFGLTTNKVRCPVCGKYVPAGDSHTDICTLCGGSGQVSDICKSSSSAERSVSESAYIMDKLTPNEQIYLYQLIRSIYIQNYVVDTCGVCKGSGWCSHCGGVQTALILDYPTSAMCMFCGGQGFCAACRGKGSLGAHYETQLNPNIDNITAQIRELMARTSSR